MLASLVGWVLFFSVVILVPFGQKKQHPCMEDHATSLLAVRSGVHRQASRLAHSALRPIALPPLLSLISTSAPSPPWGARLNVPANCTHVMINIGPNKSPIEGDEGALVILIEPLPSIVRFLSDSVKSAHVLIFQAAISNVSGTAEFHELNEHGMSSSLADPVNDGFSDGGTITTQVHTLKELLDAIPEEKPITYLKTDMQGFDLTAIKSAGEGIARVGKIQAEIYADGHSSYQGVENEHDRDWLPYMKQVGFREDGCVDAYMNQAWGIHEMDCVFVRDASGA